MVAPVRVAVGSSRTEKNEDDIADLLSDIEEANTNSADSLNRSNSNLSNITSLQSQQASQDNSITSNANNIAAQLLLINALDARLTALEASQPTILTMTTALVTSSNALQPIAELIPTLEPGKLYLLRYTLLVNQILVSATRELRINMASTDTDFAMGMAFDHSANSRLEPGTNESITIQTSNEDQFVPLDMFVKTSATGSPTVVVNVGIELADAANEITIKAGSSLRVIPLD